MAGSVAGFICCGTYSCTFIWLASSPVGSYISPSSPFSNITKEQQPSDDDKASISSPRQLRSVRAAQWQLPIPQSGSIFSVLNSSTAEVVATAQTMQQLCWKRPPFSFFLTNSRGQNLQIRAGSPLVGIRKEGLSRKFFRQRKQQYSGRLSASFCQMPAGSRKSYPSGEKSGLRKKVGTLSSANILKPDFCSAFSSSSLRWQSYFLRDFLQQNSVSDLRVLMAFQTLTVRSLLQLMMCSIFRSTAIPCTNFSCSSSTFTWYFFSTFHTKMRLSIPAETINLPPAVQRRSSTSSVCPMSLVLADQRKMRYARLMERQFSRFCQMVMHLSSEPEASSAPLGEQRTTLVLLSASLSPYRMRRFLLWSLKGRPSFIIYQIFMQPSVPSRYYYRNLRSSEPALANSREVGWKSMERMRSFRPCQPMSGDSIRIYLAASLYYESHGRTTGPPKQVLHYMNNQEVPTSREKPGPVAEQSRGLRIQGVSSVFDCFCFNLPFFYIFIYDG